MVWPHGTKPKGVVVGRKESMGHSEARSAKTYSGRASVQRLQERPHAQVLIIGGGINGVGTFRDLALQGVDVALVERGDYCQGASGASSHMIHGGIRYLENGEFRLVQESVMERNRLLRIAPHYVKPLQTTIPIFSMFSGVLSAPLRFLTHKQHGKPKERGAFLIKLGLSLYDSFSRDGGSVPRHQFRGRKQALAELPQLHPGIKYAATYFDASVHNPERLTLDVLQDGEKAGARSGAARASNYVSLQAMKGGPRPGSEATGVAGSTVQLRDELTGEVFGFTADVIVNTTGAWVDLTNQAMGEASSFMGGTKGSHIVLDHPELLEACQGREIFFEHTDGRIVLIYPMGDRVLVGTTDVDADLSQDAVCTDEEIDYFFDLIGHVFPNINVRRDQIVYTFSGVRPLPRHEATQPGFVSRDYRIERRTAENETAAPGARAAVVLSLVGGKWTTFRALAEHMANDVLAELGMERKVSTAKLAIGGGAGFPEDEAGVEKWIKAHMSVSRDADRTAVLLTRYGTRAEEVIKHLDAAPDRLLHSTRELSVRELEYMATHEQVGHLADVLIRRTSLAFRGLVTGELLNEMAEVLGPAMNWDGAAKAAEIHRAVEVLERFHRVQIHSLVD